MDGTALLDTSILLMEVSSLKATKAAHASDPDMSGNLLWIGKCLL